MEGILDSKQIDQFITNGFIRLDNAFSKEIADNARGILWKDLGVNPDDPGTWTKPVIRLGMYSQEPFVQAANTEVLHNAFDQLVGKGRWIPRRCMRTFPVRFPSVEDPGDTGWHVDASFPGARTESYFDWRINVAQPHHGKEPRFMGQPPLELKEELVLERPEGNYTPLEESIRLTLNG